MVTEAAVWDALRGVCDPELPVSIVDLGMIYQVRLEGEVAYIAMTFTSIGCPAIDILLDDVTAAVLTLPGVRDVRVEIVWNPPWTKERITERGRKILATCGVVG